MPHDAGPGVVEFVVKVVPGASRTRLCGWIGDALKVAVAAPPEAGRANAQVLELLAAALGARRGDVCIVAGGAHPRKVIRVNGLSAGQVRARLAAACR